MRRSRRGVVVPERQCLGEPLAVDGDDPLDERLPGQPVRIDVANHMPAGVALAQPHGFAAAIDARGAARLLHQPLLDQAPPVRTATHSKIQSLRSGGRPSWAASAR